MTDAQFKALKFALLTDSLDYDKASHWSYPHRPKLPCTGGALKVLIRTLQGKGWIDSAGAITDAGNTAYVDEINRQASEAAEPDKFAEYE